MHNAGKTNANRIKVNTQGGELQVELNKKDGVYNQIHLIGPAKQVFKGEIVC